MKRMNIETNPGTLRRSTKACCMISGGFFICLFLLGLSTIVTGCILIGLSYNKRVPPTNPLYYTKAYEREYLRVIGPIILVIGIIFFLLPLAVCCIIVKAPKEDRFFLPRTSYQSLAPSLYDLPPLYEQVRDLDTQQTKDTSTVSFISILDYPDRPPPYDEVNK